MEGATAPAGSADGIAVTRADTATSSIATTNTATSRTHYAGRPLSALSTAQLTALLTDQGIEYDAGMPTEEMARLPPWPLSFARVRASIAGSLHDPSHDDGSYTPLLIRFAWHSSGTFDLKSGTGGSDGGTIWRAAEAADPENAGLEKAREWLRRLRTRHPWVTMADLGILAAYVAIERSGGPHIPFGYGRRDFTDAQAVAKNGPSGCPFGDGSHNPCGSRLPAADLGRDTSAPHGCPMHVAEAPTITAMRQTFQRMGFDDRQTVNLVILGHQYGRCHPEASGYEHPWYVFGPTEWNVYLGGLGYISVYTMLDRMREERSTKGRRQFNLHMFGGEPFMMLPTDMALSWDPGYRKWLSFYDRERAAFRRDARDNFKLLTELGCDALAAEAPCAPEREVAR